jgi:molybdopterin biosynthesis enzyme MoaB
MIEVGLLLVGHQPEGLAAVRRLLPPDRFREAALETVPDEVSLIRRSLRIWADVKGYGLVLTVGGAAIGPRERAPEAALELLERPVPGLAELMRLAGMERNRSAALFRGVAGLRARTLIVNLPAQGTAEALEAILPVLPGAVEAVR